jgi:hypothetical protein
MTTPRRKWMATTRVKRRRKIDAPDRNASREADKASYEAEIAKRLDLTDKLEEHAQITVVVFYSPLGLLNTYTD